MFPNNSNLNLNVNEKLAALTKTREVTHQELCEKVRDLTGETVNLLYDFKITRFGPSKKYWYFSYKFDNYHAVTVGSWNFDFEETTFSSSDNGGGSYAKEEEYRRIAHTHIKEERERAEKECEEKTKKILSESTECKDHPYLKKKRIKPNGLIRQSDNMLLVPVINQDKVVGLQKISPDGQKRFVSGTKLKGSFFPLSPLTNDKIETIYLCEGYATGATIHESLTETGDNCQSCVIIAFNASNLVDVSHYIRSIKPLTEIIICADKDQASKTGIKAGEYYAERASKEVTNCRYILPDCGVIDKCDFNDLGVEATRSQLLGDKIVLKDIEVDPDEINFKKMKLPKFRGYAAILFNHIYSTSPVKRTRFSAASTLAIMAHAISNTFTCNGVTTHLYTMILGGTASGKNHPLKMASSIFCKINKHDTIIGKPSSDYALCDAISPQKKANEVTKSYFPKQLIVTDEAEDFFNSMSNSSDSFGQRISSLLLSLYTSTGDDFLGVVTKNNTRRGFCFSPAVSILGSMTIDGFSNCINNKTISSGLAGRFLFFPDSEKRNPEDVEIKQPPKEILDWITKLMNIETRTELTMTDSAKVLYNEACKRFNSLVDDSAQETIIYSRCGEIIKKLAIIDAVSFCPIGMIPVLKTIEHNSVNWAINFYEAMSSSVVAFFSQKVSMGINDKVTQTIETLIANSGSAGISKYCFLHHKAIRSLNRRSYDINSELKNMVESGIIFESRINIENSRKKSSVFIHSKFIKNK